MKKIKVKKLKILLLSFILLLGIGAFGTDNVHAKKAYDLSQWQGYITNREAHKLRHEVNFTILRARHGIYSESGQGSKHGYADDTFKHNSYEMHRNNIPYGAYDYSLYSNKRQARREAHSLFKQAPQAKFYVNDSEENRAGRKLNHDTIVWAKEMRKLTNKPIVLYSYLSFMNKFTHRTRKHYNAIWLADYNSKPHPKYHYDLWQYTDHHHSKALHESVDASIIPNSRAKPLSFWTRGKIKRHKVRINPKLF